MNATPQMSELSDTDVACASSDSASKRPLAWVRVFPLGSRLSHFWAISRQITGGGLVLVTTRELPLNSRLIVDIFPDLGPSLRVRAQVVRKLDDLGFGCMFTHIPRGTGDRLAHWLGRSGGLPTVAGTINT